MRHPLEYQAIARGDEPFVMSGGTTVTYSVILDRARAWAGSLQAHGAAKGDRIALLGHNSVAWIEAALGAWLLGATVVPLNAMLAEDALAELVAETRPSVTIALGAFGDREWSERQLTRPTQAEPTQLPRWDIDSIATVFFTSGTTGRPKPVPHTWRQLAASASASAFNLGVLPEDRWLCVLPLFHVGGLSIVLRSMMYGTALILQSRFTVDGVFDGIEWGATVASFVPTMLYRVLDDPRADGVSGSSLRAILLGGGPATETLLERATALDLPVFQTYGMTEAASQITTMPPAAAARRIGSAGLPVFGADVEIRDDSGRVVGPGNSGNIWVRGPMITSGYLDRPQVNAQLFDDGWFCTGDFGVLDADGFLWVETRRDDLIVSGGENVYPAQVESALASAPGVDEVAVVGAPDDEWGERVVAFVVGDVDVSALRAWSEERLGKHQRPREWRVLEELPHNASGKVLRRELRDQLDD